MADTTTLRKERVLIDDSVMETYRLLRSDSSSQIEATPFATYKDIFVLAACLGFKIGQRSVLPVGAKTDIRETIFTESDFAILKAIAIAETGDIEVLLRPGEVLQIAEQFAHAGIHYVRTWLIDERGKPLWNLVDMQRQAMES